MFSKKHLYLFTILIILIPVIVNILMNSRLPLFPVGLNNDWIGFFGSFLGSIVGGGLTLLGVKLTLDYQSDKEYINTTPKKIMRLHKMSKSLNNLNNHIVFSKGAIDKKYIASKIEELLEEASSIDSLVFSNIVGIETECEVFFEKHSTLVKLDNWGASVIVDQLEYIELVDRTSDTIDNVIKFVDKYKYKLKKKYNRIESKFRQ
ncbi:hypothetical protein [Sutcliffiella rhizosphaerae]|uniref:Uncharacterized protein n=1 Tax=Sutcliffiella rhizosphaerae TaxID=2880967 RepID=A0ABN8A748_9BACI|nr:hypothetical protein [Sutcliffiella rhizosphaerae]CAG9620865.1 hypothetical protein BACCIP111883_01636 [Sutcliffiella rhizosphaerae]